MRRKTFKITETLSSDGTCSANANAPTVSGAYIALFRSGELERVAKLRREYARLAAQLSKTDQLLSQCNDPNWLDEQGKRASRKGRNFEKDLKRHVKSFEEQKIKTTAQSNKVRAQLQKIDVQAPAGTFTTLAIPFDSRGALESQGPRIGSKENVQVRVRDEFIRKNGKFRHEEICRKLDFELMQQHGQPPIGFPTTWQENYGVANYHSAYKDPRCKNLVQKLISKAKQGF